MATFATYCGIDLVIEQKKCLENNVLSLCTTYELCNALHNHKFAGENAIVIVGGANTMLQPEEVGLARELVARAKIVVCQLEIEAVTTLAALKMAKQLGGKDIMYMYYCKVVKYVVSTRLTFYV